MNYSKVLSTVLAVTITLCGCKSNSNSNVGVISNDTELKESVIDYLDKLEIIEDEVTKDNEVTEDVSEGIKENEVMYFGYVKNDTCIYSDTIQSEVVSEINKYEKVLITKELDYYYLVTFENGLTGYINNEEVGVLPDMFVEVDISSQTVNFYIDNELYMSTPCVTGNGGIHTRTGYFEIAYKAYDTYLKGPGYKSHVYFWMPFDKAIGLHDADGWRSEYGGDIYLTNGSHGCINMPYDAAEVIYNNVSAGTKVLIHK